MNIQNRLGKKKGEIGVTVHIYQQYHKPMFSKTLTLQNTNVDEVYEKIRFFFTVLGNCKGKIKIMEE
jgi:hypothetical protein